MRGAPSKVPAAAIDRDANARHRVIAGDHASATATGDCARSSVIVTCAEK
jgi:hypothetical protein